MDQCHPGQKLPLAKRPSIQEINPEGVEAVLTEAVKAGEVQLVSKYLGEILDRLAGNLYRIAVCSSTVAIVAQFLISGQSIDEVRLYDSDDPKLTTPLVMATEACNLEVVKYLLTHGCEFYKERRGQNDIRSGHALWMIIRRHALDHAIQIRNPQQRLEAIITLRGNGYDLTKRQGGEWQTRRGRQTWRNVLRRDKSESDCIIVNILEVLKRTSDKHNLNACFLSEVVKKFSVEVGRWLVQNGADVNSRGSNIATTASTPLYFACLSTKGVTAR